MSFVRNFEGEGHTLHGGYWPAFDGNNYINTNRKRSRNSYCHANYNNNTNHDYWAKFGQHNSNSKFYNADHANYVKYDAVPSSLKRRKYSGCTWDENWRYFFPPAVHEIVPSFSQFPAPLTRTDADTSTSARCNRDCSRFEDDEPLFLSRAEIDRCSPSRKDGIDALHETHLRYSYCAFLQNLGMRLEL